MTFRINLINKEVTYLYITKYLIHLTLNDAPKLYNKLYYNLSSV